MHLHSDNDDTVNRTVVGTFLGIPEVDAACETSLGNGDTVNRTVLGTFLGLPEVGAVRACSLRQRRYES